MNPAEVSMPSDTQVQVKRSFDAEVALVWRAYTEPDLLRRWITGPPGWTMPVCEMDFRVDGEYRWRWQNQETDQEFGFFGEFRSIDPQSEFVHTQHFDPGTMGGTMGEPTLITVRLDEVEGTTTVTTTIEFQSKADRDAALATGMTDGMEMSYQKLDETLAN